MSAGGAVILTLAGVALAVLAVFIIAMIVRGGLTTVLTYDQARQFGKLYTGAMNSGLEQYAALFAPGTEIIVRGEPSDLERVREVCPPECTGHRGARLDAPEVVLTVRVRDADAGSVADIEHRLLIDDDGRIARLTV